MEDPVPAQAGQREFRAEGALCLLLTLMTTILFPRLLVWLSSVLLGTHFAPFIDPRTGEVVPYPSLYQFYSDVGITGFSLAALACAATFLWLPRLWPVAIVLMGAAALWNGFYFGLTLVPRGIASVSLLLFILGVYLTWCLGKHRSLLRLAV